MMLSVKEIADIGAKDFDSLARLDAQGFMLAPFETLGQFKERLAAMAEAVEELSRELEEKEEVELLPGLEVNGKSRIPPEVMAEAAALTEAKYGFAIDWVPGFFLSRSLGFLWGGCAIFCPDSFLSIFLIRRQFAERRRWLIYHRDELLAHELCHVARMPIGERPLEEHFAYQMSPSRLRRYLGNCFQSAFDAIFFLAPVLLLLAAQFSQSFLFPELPVFPFWIVAGLYPAFLIIRNYRQRSVASRAESNLRKWGVARPEALMFRCHYHELAFLARPGMSREEFHAWVDERAAEQPRWQVVRMRFLQNGNPGQPEQPQD